MTLIIPVGGEPLVSIGDGEDLDSNCLARTPDDISTGEYSVDSESSRLKRRIEPVPKKDESKTELGEELGLALSPNGGTESVDGTALETSKEASKSKKAELQISVNCDKDASTKGKPLVIYECRITVDSMPEFSSKEQSTKSYTPSISCNDVSSENLDDRAAKDEKLQRVLFLGQVSAPGAEELSSSLKEQKQVPKKVVISSEKSEESPTTELKNRESVSSTLNVIEPKAEKAFKIKPLPPSDATPCKNTKSISKSPDNIKMPYFESTNSNKIRKSVQRRSLSETGSTSDTDFSYLKKTRNKLRHSFSSYENCDKLHKVLDRTSVSCGTALRKNEPSNNTVNLALGNANRAENKTCVVEDSVVDRVTRKSCFEISDTLVNNVKKSMIEEYKNLKKHSSLANHDADLSSITYADDSYRAKRTQSESEGYHRNVREAFGKAELNRMERIHKPPLSACNVTPAIDIRVQRPGEAQSSNFDSVVDNGCNYQVSRSFPLTNSHVRSWESDKIERVSSPPTRLEIWKNILAEKRNSIKNHIKGFSKQADHSSKAGSSPSKPQEIVVCGPDQITVPSEPSANECKDSYTNASFIPSYSDLEKRKEAEALENNKNICIVGDTLNNKYVAVNNNGRGKDITQMCNNFICINSLHILPCIDESTKIAKVKVKSKLEEACQGIAKALDTLPEIPKGENLSNKKKLIPTSEMELSNVAGDGCNKTKLEEESKGTLQECVRVDANQASCVQSDIASIITTIPPPATAILDDNEKSQQCPTPPAYASDDEVTERKQKGDLSSTEEDSDYCQTDECGDECDYCSGEEAEDEEEEVCGVCLRGRSISQICKHTRVMTNGSLQPLRERVFHKDCGSQRLPRSRPLAFHAAMRRRPINHQELSAIREYSITSDDQQDSDEEESHDDSMCDISSSWRFGLCDDPLLTSVSSTIKSGTSTSTLPLESSLQLAKLKSNSLPASSPRVQLGSELPRRPGSVILKTSSKSEDECGVNEIELGIRLPPRPPRTNKVRHPALSVSPTGNAVSSLQNHSHPRPTMGLQGLQQRPSLSKLHSSGMLTGPKTLAPRSPLNPNPPFGFPSPPSPPVPSPGSPFEGRKGSVEGAPPSPRINSRSGALVTRNFSISDDEGGQRLSRRQVTITRHESAYKEAADKGYPLPQTSPIDPYWLTWKLGVLQKTVEDVGSRLGEAEKEVGGWGPMPQDPNLADQSVHNIRKFRETLPDLQRGIDDVNDQAARFSAHNVPLSPANSAALHDLNNRWKNLETSVNDRWRQVAGRSREVTPLTPAQLASSVSPPWERATATNKVPYYINHAQETTHWDHPQMMDLLDSLSEFNHIKFSAYRTATKLRSLQKKLSLDRAKLQLVTDVFDEHGLRGQNDRLIDVNDMVIVLSTLYGRIASDNSDVNTTLATDLCLNWLLNVYDSQRTGQMRVLSFRVGLISLCRGHLEEKYRYMFRLIADPNRMVDQRKLGLLLHDCVQVPRQLGEVAAFGGSNIEPSVRSCFTKAGKDRETIEAVHFLTWVQQEPQSLVWLAVLHRVAASESVQHQVKCNICKTYPIVGLRYRCLKCLSFDMCQRCFFEGRSSKSHKITHPMHEYCTATTAGDEMKDFTKALKNKFKSKRSLQKHTKKGYLPVQTVLEGDPLESPSPSPSHNVSSQDMHSRLELYASRLAEVELRTNSNSTPDSEDEHGLIAQYCQSLSSSDAPYPVPKSPLQIMASVDADQKDELEQMIRDLEEENRALQAEYERLKSEQPSGTVLDEGLGQRSEAEMLAEAKLLREHKGRLEARMSILEDHNRQLEAQLQRLRQLLVEQQSGIGSPNKSGTLQTKSVTASQLAMDSPAKINGHSSQGGSGSAYEGLDQMSEYIRPPPPPVGSIAHMGNLFSRAGDLEKAVGSLVASMNQEKESDSHSDDAEGNKSDENDYDNTVPVAKSN